VSDHDPIAPIEDALQKLRPAALEPSLMARLSAARQRSKTPPQKSAWRELLLRWLLPVATSACVAVITFSLLERNRSHEARDAGAKTAASADAPAPVESRDYLVSARPVGIIVAPNQQPYRIMDVEWLEHETVRAGSDDRARHTATTRRDVIPVALEIY
jgi:hypothetical protein